jgi:hypothetical protein
MEFKLHLIRYCEAMHYLAVLNHHIHALDQNAVEAILIIFTLSGF